MTLAQSFGFGVLARIDQHERRSTARASLLQVMARPELCRRITGNRVLDLVRKSRAGLPVGHSTREEYQLIAVTVFAPHLDRQPLFDDRQAELAGVLPRVIRDPH